MGSLRTVRIATGAECKQDNKLAIDIPAVPGLYQNAQGAEIAKLLLQSQLTGAPLRNEIVDQSAYLRWRVPFRIWRPLVGAGLFNSQMLIGFNMRSGGLFSSRHLISVNHCPALALLKLPRN